MGGWVDGHFDIFDILLKPPQPFTGLFLHFTTIYGSVSKTHSSFESMPCYCTVTFTSPHVFWQNYQITWVSLCWSSTIAIHSAQLISDFKVMDLSSRPDFISVTKCNVIHPPVGAIHCCHLFIIKTISGTAREHHKMTEGVVSLLVCHDCFTTPQRNPQCWGETIWMDVFLF